MKIKKIISILCAVSILLMNSGTSVHAENLSDAGENALLGDTISREDLSSLAQADNQENDSLSELPDLTVPNAAAEPTADLQRAEIKSPDIDSAALIKDLTMEKKSRSAGSITQQFTDVLTAEGESKFVQFSLAEGEIFNASLVCPKSADLDYDLVLASVADDGSATVIQSSALGTYIDPDTGKTVDEGISYIHNQAAVGNFAIFVMATAGSSSTDSFTLTISLDAAGSFDGNEPNDSPFTAKSISALKASGSLHVVNDQDWYAVKTNSGVYNVTAGGYQAEVYYASTGNKMIRAVKSGSNYVLGNGTYYVKVFSDAALDAFTFGDYTLEMADQSKYTTMQTAYNYGDWEYAYSKSPDVIPLGQQQAYYKFTIDQEDKAYATLFHFDNEKGTLIEFLDNNGTLIDYGFSGSPDVDIPVRGLIKKSNSTLENIVVNINGNQTNSVAYVRVTKVDPLDISGGGSPSIHKRIYSGYNTFKFSGTARNSGNSISTALSLNLTNNSYIPPYAVVDRISTSSSISNNVGGVHHQLNPGGIGWIASATSSATRGSFDFAGYGVQAKQPWQFQYSQTAFMSTTMSSVEMNIYWDYDIQYTNYELFNKK